MNTVIIMIAPISEHVRTRSLLNPGALVVDPVNGRIARNGTVVEIKAKMIRFLLALVARPGAIVPRDDIITLMWGDSLSGGPTDARTVIDQYWITIRATLAAVGYLTNREFGRGFSAWPENWEWSVTDEIDIPRFLPPEAVRDPPSMPFDIRTEGLDTK